MCLFWSKFSIFLIFIIVLLFITRLQYLDTVWFLFSRVISPYFAFTVPTVTITYFLIKILILGLLLAIFPAEKQQIRFVVVLIRSLLLMSFAPLLQALVQELNFCAYLGLPAFMIPLRGPHCANLARILLNHINTGHHSCMVMAIRSVEW